MDPQHGCEVTADGWSLLGDCDELAASTGPWIFVAVVVILGLLGAAVWWWVRRDA